MHMAKVHEFAGSSPAEGISPAEGAAKSMSI